MTKTTQSKRSPLPLALAAGLIAIGGGLFVIFSQKTATSRPQPTSSGQLQVIDGSNADPRQLQSDSSAIQGAAKVNDLMQGKEGAAVQQGQGVQQGVTNIDQLLQDKQIQ